MGSLALKGLCVFHRGPAMGVKYRRWWLRLLASFARQGKFTAPTIRHQPTVSVVRFSHDDLIDDLPPDVHGGLAGFAVLSLVR